MAKRTAPSDAEQISDAADLETLVEDKRANWRASGKKGRRRQRRYKNLLTYQLIRLRRTADGLDDIEGDD